MDNVFDKIFSVLNQGMAAISAAKAAETGTGIATPTITGVQLTPEQRASQSTTKTLMWVGGIAIAGLAIWYFMKKRS